MSWVVTLEDENRQVKSSSIEFEIDATIDLSKFVLLRYLDPYGDTIFNRVQIQALIEDLLRLKSQYQVTALDEVIALAEQCKQEIHAYLVFYGD